MCKLCFSLGKVAYLQPRPLSHECQRNGILSFIGKGGSRRAGLLPSSRTKMERLGGSPAPCPRWRGKALREAGQPSWPGALVPAGCPLRALHSLDWSGSLLAPPHCPSFSPLQTMCSMAAVCFFIYLLFFFLNCLFSIARV